MTNKELLYRNFCKRNKDMVKRIMRECLQFNDGRFENALKRLEGKRFWLTRDEQLEVIREWCDTTMSVQRAIVLAHYCQTPLDTFNIAPLYKEYVISEYGIFYKEENAIFNGSNFIGRTYKPLKEWMREYERREKMETTKNNN